jgi:hypothetical protein
MLIKLFSARIFPLVPFPQRISPLPGIIIQTGRPHVETLLAPYRETIGRDYLGYRNHVYRAITYALHFLNGQHEQLIETVFVYHDLGLWTDRELAYLEPSESLAVSDNEKFGWGLDPVVLRDAIHWHHKIFRYHGPNQDVVEACRKADWIDASKGWCRKGMSRRSIRLVEKEFPNYGFHASLVRLARDYGGTTIAGGIKVARGILKW